VSEEEGALRDLHAAVARLSDRLEDLARRLPSREPAPSPPAGRLLDEAERRRLGGLHALLAVGLGGGVEQALRLALDRAVHRAGADVAAALVRTREGQLAVAAAVGFPPVPSGEVTDGIAARAYRESEAVKGEAEDAERDPLMRSCGLSVALAVPVPGGGAPSLGALFAGRRRPAPFGGSSLRTLALLARLVGAALVEAGRAPETEPPPPATGPRLSTELDLERVARAIAAAAAERLGGAVVALLIPESASFAVAALAGGAAPAPAAAPLPFEPGSGVLGILAQSRRPWLADGGGDDATLARLLGVSPRLGVPLQVDDQLVGLLVAGADRPLEVSPLQPMLADAAAAIRNARLYRDAVLGLAEARGARRPTPDPPAPARDFANLLAVVLGRLTALRDRTTEAEAIADLDVAEEAAWRAAEGVRGLLGFAPGERAAPLEPLNVGLVVREAVDQALARWTARPGPAPVVELAVEAVPPVRGSPDDLREAVEHVLHNAAEAGSGEKPIVARVRWDGGARVEVAVEDHGSGMDETVRARALEPFFSTKGPGRLGLGLPVAHAIVARHHGTLRIESAPGAGTTVRFSLPTVASGRRPVGATAPVARVLVIEDEAPVRDALVEALTQQGHLARVAADGRAGLAVVEGEPVDAVVTDLVLPEMSGLEVAGAVKRLRPGTPVILVTAWPGQTDAACLERNGVDAVVEKPVGLSEFRSTLTLVLARRGSRGRDSGSP
jgi:signal transduction histidine kinase/CheY-like chemotaxis protein